MNTIFQATPHSHEEKREEIVEKPGYSDKFTPEANMLLDYYKTFSRRVERPGEPKIKVGETLSLLAVVYERVRNAVDYKGEHLLRRNAVERIIRRSLWENPAIAMETSRLSDSLIRELIWAKYLENNSVPKTKSKEISRVLDKYLRLSNILSQKYLNRRQFAMLNDWFLGITSAEIEEILDPSLQKVDVLGLAIHSWFIKKFEWVDANLSEEEKNIQLDIVIHRSLFKSDDARVRYHLLKHYYPDWKELTEMDVSENSDRIVGVSQEIESHISVPYQARLYRVVQRHTAQFQILSEIIDNNPEEARELFEDPELLSARIGNICDEKYSEIGRRISRGIRRSIIYIFATKVLLALLFEVPFEVIFFGGVKPVPVSLNLIVPPMFMFLVGLTIKKPDRENTRVIIGRLNNFIYSAEDEEKTLFSLALKKQNTFMNRVFWTFYSLLFIVTFGLISLFLMELHFSIVSGLIFFMFLSLVLLFGLRLRFSASELNVAPKREGLLSDMLTNLSLPLLNLGVWMSSQLTKVNFLIVVLDFLIEAPLKSILGIFQEWASFIRERREEVIEVPTN